MKELFRNFKCRKIILAAADIFIICIAALIANFILSFNSADIDESKLIVSSAVSSICCTGSLLITGAYSKMWRYFNKKDYLACIYGAIVGIVVSAARACGQKVGHQNLTYPGDFAHKHMNCRL